MALSAGDILGPYEILAPLGAGGMGEVYRARDTQLEREVAIKALPGALAHDPERLARFDREAKILAALNHPNIAVIHGLVERDGQRGLVMELVQGETLGQRMKHGPVPTDQALQVALQIAEALEAAHEKGIVHRDLKPGNVMITPSGGVKVLDFGLSAMTQAGPSAPADPNNSPTLTMGMTKVGVILGTAAYMSPEQAAGKAVDRRTDIWSFGVVLHELLMGRQLFSGETVSHTLANVLRGDIDLTKLPPDTPPAIRELLRRCLDRNLKNRLSHIAEARIALDHGTEPPAVRQEASRWPWAVSAVLALALAAMTFGYLREKPVEVPVITASILPPGQARFLEHAISPNGKVLAFTALSAGKRQLWVRPLHAAGVQALPGTDGAFYPFWSPDSRSIGFFTPGRLKRIEASGGPVQTLCDVAGLGLGGTWSADGFILLGQLSGGLVRIPAQGGTPVPATASEGGQTAHRWPVSLPGGRLFLYSAQGSDAVRGIYLATLDSPERTRLTGDFSSADHAAGHLLFVREGTLIAQPFDSERRRLTGEAFSVAEKVGVDTSGWAGFSSANGMLVVGSSGGLARLAWMDRTGKRLEWVGEGIGGNLRPRLSPDGTQAVYMSVTASNTDIWVRELARGISTRFTFDPSFDTHPAWAPDGSRIVFASNRAGTMDLYIKDSRGAGQEQLLLTTEHPKYPTDWGAGGRLVVYYEVDSKTQRDLWIVPPDGDRRPVLFLKTGFNERDGAFSPDSRWIAYASDESGRYEIYVQPYPATGAKRQVSREGGVKPRWRRDGKEMYWLEEGGMLVAAPVDLGDGFRPGLTQRLFPTGIVTANDYFDVSLDGKRFLIPLSAEEAESTPLTLLQNWLPGTKR
jgi:eukaryotic-like serine/threonine-protein kinase